MLLCMITVQDLGLGFTLFHIEQILQIQILQIQILTRDDCSLVDLCIHPPTISDHGLVTATILFLHDAPSYLARQIRGWRKLDRDAFRSALLEVPAIADPSILADFSVADIFATYETT